MTATAKPYDLTTYDGNRVDALTKAVPPSGQDTPG